MWVRGAQPGRRIPLSARTCSDRRLQPGLGEHAVRHIEVSLVLNLDAPPVHLDCLAHRVQQGLALPRWQEAVIGARDEKIDVLSWGIFLRPWIASPCDRSEGSGLRE